MHKQLKSLIHYIVLNYILHIANLLAVELIIQPNKQMQEHFQIDFQDQRIVKNKASQSREQQSQFNAWDSDSILMDNNNTNLLRNFNSQLQSYQIKYSRQKCKTIPIKLPSLKRSKQANFPNLNPKHSKKYQCQQKPLTQRKPGNQQNKDNLYKHKSIQLGKKSSKQLKGRTLNFSNNNNKTLVREEQSISIAKIHQVKFQEKQKSKRLRKRDIYLSIFGQRGRNKVQKITFDDQNQPYLDYLQRKKQHLKSHVQQINRPKALTSQPKQRCSEVMRF